MSKLKILVAGDPVLRQKAQEVERMDKKTSASFGRYGRNHVCR